MTRSPPPPAQDAAGNRPDVVMRSQGHNPDRSVALCWDFHQLIWTRAENS